MLLDTRRVHAPLFMPDIIIVLSRYVYNMFSIMRSRKKTHTPTTTVCVCVCLYTSIKIAVHTDPNYDCNRLQSLHFFFESEPSHRIWIYMYKPAISFYRNTLNTFGESSGSGIYEQFLFTIKMWSFMNHFTNCLLPCASKLFQSNKNRWKINATASNYENAKVLILVDTMR